MNIYRNLPTLNVLIRYSTTLLVVLATLLATTMARAHAPQENYVWLNGETENISGRFELNIKDIRSKLDINLDELGEDRLEGAIATADQVQAFLLDNFSISDSEGELQINFQSPTVFQETGSFIQYPFTTDRLPVTNELTVSNTIFITPEHIADDRWHRSLIVAEHNKAADKEFGLGNVALVFGPNNTEQVLDMDNPGSILTWKDFLWQGVLHIGIGLDHILFIVVLLLTVVLSRQKDQWVPVASFKSAFMNTLKIVTLFTIAHSITLSLSALDLVSMPTAFVETVIALSIIAIAVNNIFPRYTAHSWILIFVFGLFHGLGFALVMGELPFRNGNIELILLMFNIGVEIGQLIIVAFALPILFLLRKTTFYKSLIVNTLSILAILMSAYWVAERTGLINA